MGDEHSHSEQRIDRRDTSRTDDHSLDVSRRQYLAATAGILGGAGLAGQGAAKPGRSARLAATDGDEREDFMWFFGNLMWNPELYQDDLSFMRRHDLNAIVSVGGILSGGGTNQAEIDDKIVYPLAEAEEAGIDAWLSTGSFLQYTARELATNESAMEEYLGNIELLAATYAEYYPDGKFILGQEEPLFSNWGYGGMRRYGAEIITAVRDRIKSVSSGIDVGFFPHYPAVAFSDPSESVYGEIGRDLERMGETVDFTFTDFYRGYYTSRYQAANDTLRELITNSREITGGRPVYNLAEDHTVNTNYTPSKQAMRGNLDVLLDTDVDGMGWYHKTNYDSTDFGVSFNPYIPNVDDDALSEIDPWVNGQGIGNTSTFARDRFQYAYSIMLASKPGYSPAERFTLWLYGEDFDFQEHRLFLKNTNRGGGEGGRGNGRGRGPKGAGEWEFVSDFDGYLDEAKTYAGNGEKKVSAFHALSRDRFLGGPGGNKLQLEIGTGRTVAGDDGEGSYQVPTDGSTLEKVVVLPFDPGVYMSEPKATEIVQSTDNLPAYTLGHKDVRADLTPDTDTRVQVTVPKTRPAQPLQQLLYPGYGEQLSALEGLESRDSFEPENYFDLWFTGENLTTGTNVTVSTGSSTVSLSEASVARDATGDALVLYGIDIEYLDAIQNDPPAASGDASLSTAYPMPYFSSDNFKTAAVAADLIATDGAINSFSYPRQGGIL